MKTRSRLLLAAGLMTIVLAAGLIAVRQDAPPAEPAAPVALAATGTAGTAPSSADPRGSADSNEKMEYIGAPPGPYDPVLTQPAPPGMALPPTNRRCNNPAGEGVAVTQAETSIIVSGNYVVAGWNDAIGFYQPSQTISGYGYSTDRGNTWVDGGSVPEGNNTALWGDPAVTVTNAGWWIFASLDQATPNGLGINRAQFVNGTLTWNPAIKFTDGNQFLDKEYIDYDPFTNRVYMTYTNFGTQQGRIIYSTNDGLNWSAPVTISNSGTGFYPAPGIDGEVYVSWSNNLYVYQRYSPDGGVTWPNNAVRVVILQTTAREKPQCFNRNFNMTWPSMSVDRSNGPHRGRAYMVWNDGGPGNFDCWLSYSDAKGATNSWSTPVKLNDEQNVSEQFWPQVHVGPDGRVTVGWYDRRKATNNNSLCDFYVTQSVDGGTTWGPNRRLSDTSAAWCGVPADAVPNFGDYIELTSDDLSVFGCWCDSRDGGPNVYMGRFDDRQILAVSGNIGQELAQFATTGTAWLIPNEAEIVADPAPPVDSAPQLLVSALAQALLASPPETQGLFQIAGDALSGNLNLSSASGPVNGTFGVSRVDVNNLDFDFTATSAQALANFDYLETAHILGTLVPAGPGQVNVYGTASIDRTAGGPLTFSMGGTIFLDGAPGAILAANQSIDVTVRIDLDGPLVVHTRTTVVDGVTVDVEPLSPGTNPPPTASVRATPNPVEATTRIVFMMTHLGTGTVTIHDLNGRVVRTLASGRFEPGTIEIPFDGKDDNGNKLPASGYFLRVDTDVAQAAGKLFIVH